MKQPEYKYPIKCPHCDLIVDSRDSMSDSRQDLRYHIEVKHPDKIRAAG